MSENFMSCFVTSCNKTISIPSSYGPVSKLCSGILDRKFGRRDFFQVEKPHQMAANKAAESRSNPMFSGSM